MIAADGGLDQALALGLRVDLAVGDFDSASAAALAAASGDGTRIERHPAAKDATDLELALDAARRARRRAASSCSAAPAAASTTCSRRCSCSARERYAGVEVDALVGQATVHVVRGERRAARASRASSSRCCPCTGPPRASTTEGLAYPLRGETLAPGSSRGVSNVFAAAGGPRRARARRPARRPPRPGSEEPSDTCCKARRRGALRAALALAAAGCGGGESAPTRSCSSRTTRSPSRSRCRAPSSARPGLRLRILQAGDAGEALNRALLTAGDPQGDVLFGVDNNLLSRALDEDLFEPYESPELDAGRPGVRPRPEHRVTPDRPRRGLPQRRPGLVPLARRPARRRRSSDLTRSRATAACSSSRTRPPRRPGSPSCSPRSRASATTAGRRYWRALRANGVLVVDGWEEAYTVRFSGSAGKGTRPIVVSYASSPPAEVIFAGKPLDGGAHRGRRGELLPPGRARRRPPRRAATRTARGS